MCDNEGVQEVAMKTMETTTTPPLEADVPLVVPEFHNGDRLTREEFHRRYQMMTRRVRKAELIEGVVYVPSPVRQEHHGEPHVALVTWIGIYRALTPFVRPGDNSSLFMDQKNEPQPDALLMIDPAHGGQARLEDGYIVGAPEWIGEVAASSASYDLHDKLQAYCRNGVREYFVWRVLDRAIDWFVLREGRYEQLASGPDGLLRSEVFAGLWLDPQALLAGDLIRVMDVVQQGAQSPDHAEFVQKLRSKGATT